MICFRKFDSLCWSADLITKVVAAELVAFAPVVATEILEEISKDSLLEQALLSQ